MKYEILFSNQFKRSFKKCIKRGYDKSLSEEVITILFEKGTLPPHYKPHKLSCQWSDYGNAIFNSIGF